MGSSFAIDIFASGFHFKLTCSLLVWWPKKEVGVDQRHFAGGWRETDSHTELDKPQASTTGQRIILYADRPRVIHG